MRRLELAVLPPRDEGCCPYLLTSKTSVRARIDLEQYCESGRRVSLRLHNGMGLSGILKGNREVWQLEGAEHLWWDNTGLAIRKGWAHAAHDPADYNIDWIQRDGNQQYTGEVRVRRFPPRAPQNGDWRLLWDASCLEPHAMPKNNWWFMDGAWRQWHEGPTPVYPPWHMDCLRQAAALVAPDGEECLLYVRIMQFRGDSNEEPTAT